MDYCKLAFFGNVGAGKSQVIKTLSEIKPIDTDVESTLNIGKKMTTVGIDYGRIHLDNQTVLGLYGVPGQSRYKFLWESVVQSLWCISFLFKFGSKPDLESIETLLNFFYPKHGHIPFLVGITHSENCSDLELQEFTLPIQELFIARNLHGPIIKLNPKCEKSSIEFLGIANTLVLHTPKLVKKLP